MCAAFLSAHHQKLKRALWGFPLDFFWGPKHENNVQLRCRRSKTQPNFKNVHLGIYYLHLYLVSSEMLRSRWSIKQYKSSQLSKVHTEFNTRTPLPPGHDTNYYDLAQSLRQRITDMKIKIDRQLRILATLKDRVKDQVVEMQRLEVRRYEDDKDMRCNWMACLDLIIILMYNLTTFEYVV